MATGCDSLAKRCQNDCLASVVLTCDAERRSSAPLEAIDLLGESPSRGIVTALHPTVVTAFA